MLKQMLGSLLPRRLRTTLRLLLLQRAIAGYRARWVRHTYGGYPLEVYLSDPLAEGWYDHDWPELPEIALLRRGRLKPGACVFDLGAHQGIVALILSQVVGPGGKVIAVEANPHNAEAARRNRERNRAQPLHIEHAAVAQECGTVRFNRGLNGQVDNGEGEWGQVEVRAVSIDALAQAHGFPDVLFVDVEGFELRALRGARQCLERQPDCFVEVHVGCGLELFGGSAAEVLSCFHPDAYELFAHSEEDPRPRPLVPDSPMLEQRFFLTALARQR